jgi:G3E family GTPase
MRSKKRSTLEMKLHIVGGFLGSGKTTAIIHAARLCLAQGLRVGVITNDQGKYLVDTHFFRVSDLPTVEVTGGCFCCNYDDLNNRLEHLLITAQPDIIFAESVGSCADLIATVIKPLLLLPGAFATPDSFSVFTDARLFLRRLRGDDLPFSEDVVYIFDKQIEESGLLVVNKIDLLPPDKIEAIQSAMLEKYPQKACLLQSSLEVEGVSTWVKLIQAGKISVPEQPLAIDYKKYAAGEASLAWLDQSVTLTVPENTGKQVIEQAVRRLATSLTLRKAGIGHLKFFIEAKHGQIKLSFPTLEEPGWEKQIPRLLGKDIHLLVNARAELNADELRRLLTHALTLPGVKVSYGAGESFHPKEPKPTHRYY